MPKNQYFKRQSENDLVYLKVSLLMIPYMVLIYFILYIVTVDILYLWIS